VQSNRFEGVQESTFGEFGTGILLSNGAPACMESVELP
jgi:hypothetical protein